MAVFKDFLQGAGSILNLYPSDKDMKINLPEESDEEAIRKDWEAVGNDIRFGIENCANGKK